MEQKNCFRQVPVAFDQRVLSFFQAFSGLVGDESCVFLRDRRFSRCAFMVRCSFCDGAADDLVDALSLHVEDGDFGLLDYDFFVWGSNYDFLDVFDAVHAHAHALHHASGFSRVYASLQVGSRPSTIRMWIKFVIINFTVHRLREGELRWDYRVAKSCFSKKRKEGNWFSCCGLLASHHN